MQPATLRLLAILARSEGADLVKALCSGSLTADDLTARTGLSPSQVSRDLRELEALGLATRTRAPAEGRGRPREEWTIPAADRTESLLRSIDEFVAGGLEDLVDRHRLGMEGEYREGS